MLEKLRKEVRATDLTGGRRIFLLILVSMGSSTIYAPAYLKGVFYDPLMGALHCTNADLGMLLSAYAITATICYLPSGIVADKVRVRTLGWVGFTTTAVLTYVYALLPSITTLMFVFIGMGITTILIWWGIRFKLVRLISTEDEYSKNIGVSYGIYGAAGLVVGLINMWIVNAFVDNMEGGVRTLLIFLGSLILLLGILSFLFIPRFEGEIDTGEAGFNLKELGQVVKNPVVWLSAACMFFVYFYYTGVTYTTPYLSGVLGASLGIVSLVSVIRTYGITLLSGPAFGFLARKTGSPSQVIWIGSVVAALALVGMTLLPSKSSVAILAAVIIIALGFIANGVFGIVSSQLTEGRVPITIFGTATGILSVIGFLPDTFSSTWFGSMIDSQGNDAYRPIFLILAGAAVISAVFAIILLAYVRRNAAKLKAVEAAAAAELAAADAKAE
ncbi:MFS transporter [Schaalia naturae]|uniref:MFS transporter n=1 Tax=Schaalia naturae TaxID=635203 RepID=A0ABW2SL62_9ACTO